MGWSKKEKTKDGQISEGELDLENKRIALYVA